MISKRFYGPIGTGVRKLLVAPEATDLASREGRKITVITSHEIMTKQFRQWLPNACYLQPNAWLARAEDGDADLIIVDELPDFKMAKIEATLEKIACEVWLVNPHDFA